MRKFLGLVAIGIVGLTACTSTKSAAPAPSTSAPSTSAPSTSATPSRSVTPTPTKSFTPGPARVIPPLAPGQKAPSGSKDGRCPYIRSGLDEDPTTGPNVADIEGNRVYRTTILTTLTPVGCRFYFAYADHDPTADILPRRFPTAVQAYNAMVLTARAGKDQLGHPKFAGNVDGIAYRTKFISADGDRDWAFVFAKGRTMVIVHTQETNSSDNARLLAKAIVAKF